jgi:ArsR family transcriptional regulator
MDLTQAEIKASIIQAMAHPVRLIIVESLADGDLRFSAISALFDYDKSTISKHLSILKSKGIVSSHKEGNETVYTLLMPCFTAFSRCIDSIIEQNVKSQEYCIIQK